MHIQRLTGLVLTLALADATLDPALSNSKGRCPKTYNCEPAKVSKAIQAAECSHNTRTSQTQTFAVFQTDHQYDNSHGAPYGTCYAYTCAAPDTPHEMMDQKDCWTFFLGEGSWARAGSGYWLYTEP